ncbi:chloride channel protein [Agarivorans sp. MS3-6]|uniref:chloride channel protein n=1 Tax=Agarivorans sp. TSD2052 TaxID=2937286 RepID=UPI00200E15B1|nr:chloride channel protein [Agarivorans sp. TSD2052]UPW19311.1 chloride channel protein [Agarivorans sp. TSD2052]
MTLDFSFRSRSLFVYLLIGLFSSALTLLFSDLAHLDINHLLNIQISPFMFPIVAAVSILVFEAILSPYKQVGLIFVVKAYHFDEGRLFWGNLLYQFAVGLILTWGGYAVGVVGPACYLTAVVASNLSHAARLTPGQVRLSVACGTAAAVAALFSAPLAGTVIAYELIMRRFNWRSIMTIALVAYTASAISQLHGGSVLSIALPPQQLAFESLPLFALLGLLCGLFATLLVHAIRSMPKLKRSYAITIAATVTAFAGMLNPQWLGLDPITPNGLLYWELDLEQQSLWLLARIVLTTVALAFALPGGSLGPMLVIGGIVGSIVGEVIPNSPNLMLVIVGMGAMFGAVFRTPWAAFLLISEQTMQLEIVLPAMVACLCASAIAKYIFRSPSLIEQQLLNAQIRLINSPVIAKEENKTLEPASHQHN